MYPQDQIYTCMHEPVCARVHESESAAVNSYTHEHVCLTSHQNKINRQQHKFIQQLHIIVSSLGQVLNLHIIK